MVPETDFYFSKWPDSFPNWREHTPVSYAYINSALQAVTFASGLALCLSIGHLSENPLRQGVKILKTWKSAETGGARSPNYLSMLAMF